MSRGIRSLIVGLAVLGALVIVQETYGCDKIMTPNGSSVDHTHPPVPPKKDLTAYERALADAEMAYKHPLAIKVAEATRRYNCHAWGWITSRNCWIEDPKKFVEDGSYVEDAAGYLRTWGSAKVQALHTSKIYSDRDMSKWGEAGRYRHYDWDVPAEYKILGQHRYRKQRLIASDPAFIQEDMRRPLSRL